jgi:N6-adenosine-specific RNA methylase IME4
MSVDASLLPSGLPELAARIRIERDAISAAMVRTLDHALVLGDLLIAAKDKVDYGKWLPWLRDNCQMSNTSAQGYMRLSKYRVEVEQMRNRCASLGIKEALNCLAAPAIEFGKLETEEARTAAIEAATDGTNVRTAVRRARKFDHEARISLFEPQKPLEGTYRILYIDPPWLYHLNQTNGVAEHHYLPMSDEPLCEFRPNGGRLVKDLADDNAVLFLWVTSPLLTRFAAIVEAWGFEYKASFIWDKVRHNYGFYNSVRHELLLVCTRGSCLPDTARLLDSVVELERSTKHSEKPSEFYEIIESMYDHGRKLELFARSGREGWDSVGNEIECLRAAA